MADVIAGSSSRETLLTISVVAEASGPRQTVLAFCGELDRSNAHQAQQAIDSALSRGVKCLVIDLERLNFIDSSGINVLARTYNVLTQRAGAIVLVAPAGMVQRVLNVVRLSTIMPIYSSLQLALADLPAVVRA